MTSAQGAFDVVGAPLVIEEMDKFANVSLISYFGIIFCIFVIATILFSSGPVQVLESFGKLWTLKMPFFRTWKVLEKERISKMALEKYWIFVWKSSKNILK